ncbi:MAG TPA: hypothetical protein VEJ23_07160 [Solirubrobacteraceae bacterium]|nr:hypothetical protein [Solirubrobacteraceae bacterium]
MIARDWLGLLRLEDGRPWVQAAENWQRTDAVEVLEGERPYSFLTRARGASKTTDLSACMLSVLLASQERLRCYWLASDGRQGELAIDCIAGFVQRTPGLAERVEVQARKVIVPATGASLEIMPADTAGAWGLTPHWLFVDEIANWGDTAASRRLWEAASSAVAKRTDARMCVLTTSSTPDHFAFKALEHARSSPLWRVSEREGPPPWASEDRLAEQRARLPQAVYEQLFENRWVSAEGSFLDPAVLDAAFALDGPALEADRGFSYVAGLDLGSVNDRTVFALGHREGDRLLLDRMEVWQGSRKRPVDFGAVEDFIVQAHRRFHFNLRLDPWQGLDLAQRLRAQSIHAEEFTFSPTSKQRLAATLLSAINAGNLLLYEADGLKDELLALRLTQTSSGLWAFDHQRGGHDDRAIALALVAVALLERAQPSLGAPIYSTAPSRWNMAAGSSARPRAMGSPRQVAPQPVASGEDERISYLTWEDVRPELKARHGLQRNVGINREEQLRAEARRVARQRATRPGVSRGASRWDQGPTSFS